MEQQFGSDPFDARVHLLDYWYIIRMRLGLFTAVFCSVVLLAVIVSLLQKPVYQGTCQLLIEPSSVQVTQLQGVYDPMESVRDFQARRDYLQTQMELIKSDKVLAEAFEHFGFETSPVFMNALERIKAFRNHVTVEATRNTFLVNVSFKWGEPRLAADVANFLAERYVSDFRQRQSGLSGAGVDKLREQLVEMRKARQEAVEALVAFKQENRIIDLEDAQELLVAQMSKLNEALVEAQVDEVTNKAVVDSVERWRIAGGELGTVPEVLRNPSITSFKLQVLSAQADLIDLQRKYGESHQAVQTQERVVKAMEDAVATEMSNSIESAQVLYERASLRSQFLSDALQELETRSFGLDKLAGEYRILADAYAAVEETYRFLINRINEINITQGTENLEGGGNILITDKAQTPKTRIAPRRSRNVALAGVAGLVLAAGLCFFLDYMDSTVKNKDELEGIMGGAAVLGFVPRLEDATEETQAVESSSSTLAEAFRTIRTSLGLSFAGRRQRCFVITSAAPGDGKTLSAFNLAVSFARDGKRVLLMECDMRRPRLRKLIGDAAPGKDEAGLSKVLVGADVLKDVVWSHPGVGNLEIAFCGQVPPNPAELLSSPRFDQVMKEAAEAYDMIVIDSPPILNVADTSIVAGKGWPLVFVARAFKTDRRQAMAAAEQAATVQGTVVGCIINNAEAPRKAYYGSYYGSRYYYRGRYGYGGYGGYGYGTYGYGGYASHEEPETGKDAEKEA
jgi:capsular exopolysaccharide synthesis family protein